MACCQWRGAPGGWGPESSRGPSPALQHERVAAPVLSSGLFRWTARSVGVPAPWAAGWWPCTLAVPSVPSSRLAPTAGTFGPREGVTLGWHSSLYACGSFGLLDSLAGRLGLLLSPAAEGTEAQAPQPVGGGAAPGHWVLMPRRWAVPSSNLLLLRVESASLAKQPGADRISGQLVNLVTPRADLNVCPVCCRQRRRID